MKDGRNQTISAKTRSWSVAEEKAAEIRDAWDPVKQRLRELDERRKTQEAEAVTIDFALDRWLTSIRHKQENDNTVAKYQTVAKPMIGAQ